MDAPVLDYTHRYTFKKLVICNDTDVGLRAVIAIHSTAFGPALAHKAIAEAEVAVTSLSGLRRVFEPLVVPAVVFSDPEVATAASPRRALAHSGWTSPSRSFPSARPVERRRSRAPRDLHASSWPTPRIEPTEVRPALRGAALHHDQLRRTIERGEHGTCGALNRVVGRKEGRRVQSGKVSFRMVGVAS